MTDGISKVWSSNAVSLIGYEDTFPDAVGGELTVSPGDMGPFEYNMPCSNSPFHKDR